MVKFLDSSLDAIFSALSDPTRRAILERLVDGEASVTELAEPFASEMTLPAISKHLRVLEDAGLITRHKEGRIHHLRLRLAPLKDAAIWLIYQRRFWDEQFDSLASYLEQIQSEGTDDEQP